MTTRRNHLPTTRDHRGHMKNEAEKLSALILERLAQGLTAKAIIGELCGLGVEASQAPRYVEAVVRDFLSVRGLDDSLALPAMPKPAANTTSGRCFAFDREIEILLSVRRPRLMLFGGLLSEQECDALIEMASPSMARSTALDPASGTRQIHPARTSHGSYIPRGQSELICRIDRRLEALLGWPLERSEDLQILRYEVGQEYEPHFDYFDPSNAGFEDVLSHGGQRVASLILYLSTPVRGGSTYFPDAGIDVVARKGNGVFFSYDAASASTMTRHAGMPVSEGEKWIATRWLREGVFQ